MYNRFDADDDIDIDGCDSNGNKVCGYGMGYERGDYSTDIDTYRYEEPIYLYKFKTKEALITSPVFQEMLGKALEHKDKTIRDLQNELLNREFS